MKRSVFLLLFLLGGTLRLAPAQATLEQSDDSMVVERNVAVPMRDGVVLRADLLRPRQGEKFPVLV